ncbi:hypothetical protein CMV_025663 [Castanea mollissima]|uniref:Disease resistance N-terminal domain-containing protein n=1 Tax=Castanea mollissima TaxID=60419 RepID=A0A8J4QJL6_9ROSI|nr:hypothetical protein CMV_025663 [Castanea mollissima]
MTEIANVIAGKILEQLRSLINQELSSAWGVQSDLKKLESTMLAIKAVLFDAEEKEAGNHRLSLWLGQLKGVLNDAENVLDEFQYRVLQKEVMKRENFFDEFQYRVLQKEVVKRCRSTCKKVCYFFSVSNPFVLRFEMAHKIKGIRERVDDISALKAEFNLAAQLEVRNTTMHKRDMSHMSHFFVPPQIVIGMDGCLANLRKLIVAFCPSLTSLSLSIKHLTALETLIIWDCEELSLMEGEENQDLELSLKKIMIGKLPKLGALPQWLQGSANTLQMLAIGYCKNLTALPEWLPRLKSLQTIGIASCPKLLSLPEGMQALTSLRELGIVHCPDLSRKCKEYFPKIDHVPEIEINGFKLTIEKMS